MAEPLRVESLRELDYRVAQHVFGWRVEEAEPEPHHVGKLVAWAPGEDEPSWLAWGRGGKPSVESGSLAAPVLRYSSSIAAAWEIVQRMISAAYTWRLDTGEVSAACVADSGRLIAFASGRAMPEAICIAALRAVGVEVELAEDGSRLRAGKERRD